MLLFQGAYFAVNNPGKKIYIYNRETFTSEFVRNDLRNFDFVLLPNFALSRLDGLPVTLMVNTMSFQEMTTVQVRGYLDFARKNVTFCMLSDNLDRHPYNQDLQSLLMLLRERFTLYPDPEYYERLHASRKKEAYRRYSRYLCFPKGSTNKPAAVVTREKPVRSLPVRIARRLVPKKVRRAIGLLK